MTIGLRRLPSPGGREEKEEEDDEEEDGLGRALAFEDDAVVDDDCRLFALSLAARARCCSKTCFSFLLDILTVLLFLRNLFYINIISIVLSNHM